MLLWGLEGLGRRWREQSSQLCIYNPLTEVLGFPPPGAFISGPRQCEHSGGPGYKSTWGIQRKKSDFWVEENSGGLPGHDKESTGNLIVSPFLWWQPGLGCFRKTCCKKSSLHESRVSIKSGSPWWCEWRNAQVVGSGYGFSWTHRGIWASAQKLVALVQKNSSHRKRVRCTEFLQFSQLTTGCLWNEINPPFPPNCKRCEPLLRTGFLKIKVNYREDV